MPTAAERLASARDHLAAGDHRKALRLAWRELMDAVPANDTAVFTECEAFANEALCVTTGKDLEQAEQLCAYARACLTSAESGRRPSLLDRLLGRSPAASLRKCPDCAETIQADARVCRFCGLRLGGGAAEAP